MPSSQLLHYTSGDFIIVTAPPVLDSTNRPLGRVIRLHHQALQEAICGRNVWEPEHVAESLYADFKPYYDKIGQLFCPQIDVPRLDTIDRHLFFVATEPIKRKDKLIAGLSQLEKLMGFTYPKEIDGDAPAAPEPPPKHTTGDSELDVLVDTMLLFKRNALPMARMLSLPDLSKACVQANNRMRVEQAENEEGSPSNPEEPVIENPLFVQKRKEVEESLKKRGVWIPEGF